MGKNEGDLIRKTYIFSLVLISVTHLWRSEILQWATGKTHPRAYQCIQDNYVISAKNVVTALSIRVVYTYMFI